MGTLVTLERVEQGIGLITLNSPEKLNALTNDLIADLDSVLCEAERADDIHVVVLTGAGRAFAAGADIKLMQHFTPEEAMAYSKRTTDLYDSIEQSNTVFIAAVNGFALGAGCELAMACDLRIASEKAKFGLPETSLGIIPGGHGTQKLPKLLGIGKAKELIFLGENISAPEAAALNLVNKVTAPEALIESALAIARKIAGGPSRIIGYAKQAINMSFRAEESIGNQVENQLFGLCFATAEQEEGMAAFIDRRPADFKKTLQKLTVPREK